jgi:hypothetical protein
VRQRPPAFPVGLYGVLLFALCWLTLPAVFAPVERWLLGAVCLPPRVWTAWFGAPALAAAPADRRTLGELTEDLHRRVRRDDELGTQALRRDHDALHCAVVATSRRGGGGLPCELQLDHTHAELADCSDWVTKGEALIGVLVRPGHGPAALDRPQDPARVMLLNHPGARPLYANVELGGGELLRTVVRAAATVDPAALRVDLWDDPYRGARLDRGGLPVRTAALAADDPRDGLLLGHTLIWGYPGRDAGQSLTLGVYVVPTIEPRALSHVVVWRPESLPSDAAAAPAARQLGRAAAVVHDLPGARNGRHLVIADGPVPDQAAVVQDGRFLGTARGLAFGTGLVTSFVASRQRWSLLLLPDDPLLPPRELDARVVATSRNIAWLRWRGAPGPGSERLTSGYLFTGSNGLHCPAGLWIGRAQPDPQEPDLLQIVTPIEPGPQPCEVLGGTRP